jgi:hypothetical protein
MQIQNTEMDSDTERDTVMNIDMYRNNMNMDTDLDKDMSIDLTWTWTRNICFFSLHKKQNFFF